MEELRYSQIRVSCSTYLFRKRGTNQGSRLFGENWEKYKLDEVLLGDIAGAEVADPIDRHNPDILDCAKKILEKK